MPGLLPARVPVRCDGVTIPVACNACGTPSTNGARCERCDTKRLRDSTRAGGLATAAYLVANPSCVLCGRPSEQVDHVVDLRFGGSPGPENWQALCGPCHHDKTHPVSNPRRDRRRAATW